MSVNTAQLDLYRIRNDKISKRVELGKQVDETYNSYCGSGTYGEDGGGAASMKD